MRLRQNVWPNIRRSRLTRPSSQPKIKKIEAIDRKFDTMNTTLLTLTHGMGELKGQMSSLIHREDH